MTEKENRVLELVKLRLGLQDEALTPLISSYIPEVGWRIKNYCHISDVPEGLVFTWASMVIDVLKSEHSTIKEIGKTIDQGGKNIKIGDTSISPASGGGPDAKSAIDSVVLNYAVDLNRYRRMTW